ncbi:hypothetical protein BO71DRAFT_377256 [Aspergillus ellipticus CBS 707.79]|uniref:SNARE complex subunit n=1 Tax=Aspergillus ellipticus CBS 707.79 TaxID=1448320 RepID=A0A319DE37_9EURO|nr:hypothetical protein BO71DRAFT_377256 [Aspergillus ellipticus CBS 707.79]
MSTMPDKRKPSVSMSGSSPYAKRSRPSYADDDDDEQPQPQHKPQSHSHSHSHSHSQQTERPRNHPVYGQKSAFPGLDVADDDNELFYGPAEDGLEYLRMVRSEANSLPFLFTAPTEPVVEKNTSTDTITTAPDKDLREGIIIDGVFFVPPPPTSNPTTTTTTTATTTSPQQRNQQPSPAQSSYYNLLHHRFLLLRSILKCTPPSDAIAALDDSHPISLPRHARNARKEWRRLLLAVDPQTVQLACIDMESVLGVLGTMARLMSENVRSGDAERVRRIGAWAWGLLAKCREVGQLGTEEVGEIRDLGKRAVKILVKMREEEEEEGDGEGEGDEEGGEEGEEEEWVEQEEGVGEDGGEGEAVGDTDGLDYEMQEDNGEAEPASAEALEAAKARLQAKIQDAEEHQDTAAGEVALQTRAMLDMIITVVGEFFGQRDLLEAREVWDSPPISPTSPPYTLYNITLRLPLRSFTISKRYSDFTTFHATLTTQTTLPPPSPLPPKSWFQNTLTNATLRESRRQTLETYLRAINEADDPRWRTSPAWRAFLNLPSLSTNGPGPGAGSLTSTRLHAAITDPTADQHSGNSITDPMLWLDCFRDMKGHLHDARLHLTRRDQETTPQKQHESSAKAKSSLVRAGGLIAALEAGLRNLSSSSSSSAGTSNWSVSGNNTLGEGEMRRRKDLLINARKEKDGMEDLLNAMAAKSRIDSAVASIQDKEALMGTTGGRKAGRSSGRVLGRETERTRELDNAGVVQLQKQMMADQDLSVNELMKVVNRQKELGIAIHNELEIQNEMLRLADEDATRLGGKIDVGKKRIGRIS